MVDLRHGDPMTAPSNANTSGLEVVAWRIREQPGTAWTVVYDHEDHRLAIADGFESEPYAVTAASAQARIAELESALAAAQNADAENDAHLRCRATAAEARADRLAKALVMLGAEKPEQKRSYPNSYRGGFDAATDLAASIARAALQQETQS